MKRITISLILVYSILLCSCARSDPGTSVSGYGSGSAVSSTATGSAVSGNAIEEEKSDKNSKIGVRMYQFARFATGMTKGDDGNIYYLRQEEGKTQKIIFYKNNGIRVCEAEVPRKYFYIQSFAKYGGYFGIVYEDENADEYFISLRIRDSKWGKAARIHPVFWEGIFYEDAFYCFDVDNFFGNRMEIIDINGNRKSITFEEGNEDIDDIDIDMQTIVDGKLYYYIEKENQKKIMCCNLDGSGKEELLCLSDLLVEDYVQDYSGQILDEEYVYIHTCSRIRDSASEGIIRIPLHGGEIRDFRTNASIEWYDMSADCFYYMDGAGNIYRIGKDLTGEPEAVTMVSLSEKYGEIPFLCADGHLMTEVCDDKEMEMLDTIGDHTLLIMEDEIRMEYANQYDWITEDGRIEDTVPGTGLNKKCQELYRHARDLRGSLFISDKYYIE